jgi:tetratricopeptide (TPR) repeat protein
MAVPAAVLLVSLSIPSAGQTTDDSNASTYVAPVKPAGQSSTAAAQSGQAQLPPEQMADILMARKDFREAAISYKRLTEQNPRNAVYWNKLGIALQQEKDLSGALKSYQRSFKLDPNYADVLNNIGTIWQARERYGKAVRVYQKAIKVRGDMAVLYSNLGYAYFGEKKYEQSIAAFHQALTLDPHIFDHSTSSGAGSLLQDRSLLTDRGRFYFLLAKSFAQTGNVERALMYLRKAKEEGYKSMNDVKTDPSFSAMLKLPETQEILLPPGDEPKP